MTTPHDGTARPADAVTAFASRLVGYSLLRATPPNNQQTMREAFTHATRLILGNAANETAELLPERALRHRLGKADWRYDAESDMHIPCCSQPAGRWRCGNGPLVGDAVRTGDCGEAHALAAPGSTAATPTDHGPA